MFGLYLRLGTSVATPFDVNPSPSSWPNNFQVSNDAFKVKEGPMIRSKSKKLQRALIGLIQDIWKAQHKNTIPINDGQVEAQRIMFTSSNEVENAPITNSSLDAFFWNFGKLQRVLSKQ